MRVFRFRAAASALLFAVVLLSGIASPSLEAQSNPVRVTASTTWVGAMAEAAGAEVLRVLAPVELRHPAEYDFRASDVRYAVEADWLVWAGYEGFMRSLFEATGFPEDRIARVHTNNSPPVLKEVVGALAEQFGTRDTFRRWEAELDALAAEIQSGAADSGVPRTRAAVHEHHRVVAEWLGYDIVAVFGPAELTPSRLREILGADPELIIDNWHMPSGEPLRGQGREYHALINFPGQEGTTTLLDVLRYNTRKLGILP